MRRGAAARLADLISERSSATADLYLRWACQDMLESGALRQIAPTVFQAGRTLVVVRHDAHLSRYPDHDRLIYVIDDDWRAGLRPGEVPLSYRMKLRFVEAESARRIEARAAMFVVPSPHLARLYGGLFPGREMRVLDPAWPPARDPLVRLLSAECVIGVLGARSHGLDLGVLLPALSDILGERPEVHVVFSGEVRLPRSLRNHPRVEQVPPMHWREYLAWAAGRSFAIGLYPLRPTAFNAARSINKLLEYDQFGAAVVASRNWEAAGPAAAGGRCLLVDDNAAAWKSGILRLMDDPGAAVQIATRNRAAIRTSALAARQRAFWTETLFG